MDMTPKTTMINAIILPGLLPTEDDVTTVLSVKVVVVLLFMRGDVAALLLARVTNEPEGLIPINRLKISRAAGPSSTGTMCEEP